MADLIRQADAFLGGAHLDFKDANDLWRSLKKQNETSLARQVLSRIRAGKGLLDKVPRDRKTSHRLCQQEALLTSKDKELSATVRHDRALDLLDEEFYLDDEDLDDGKTLGIAGGICKRRWSDLGQHEDLQRAAAFYRRGAGDDLGKDAYAHINAAFLEDLLASTGDDADERRRRATEIREKIVADLPILDGNWWNVASRAEAYFGLGEYGKATKALGGATKPEALWKLETTARQLATLAYLRADNPLAVDEIKTFFETLLPGAGDALRSAFVGKVGLALSGGGFRASFYHLGVLARLAELNVLRHVDVLSCVSGGSIIGACYWLALRRRMIQPEPMGHHDYIEVIRDLIAHFETAVGSNLRAQAQPGKAQMAFQMLLGNRKGAMSAEDTAAALEEHFLRPLFPGDGSLYMDELPFTPGDDQADLHGGEDFHPSRHNWLRANNVPALVLNATTVNTGHAWQFTPTWMGESPWAVHEAADAIPRLEWAWFDAQAGWRMTLGKAVAASAAVPMLFSPLQIDDAYEGFEVQLVDGGVHDNQGSVALLALDCNVLLVSDAAGQLQLEQGPTKGLKGLAAHATRNMNTLMERVRQANYGDLAARSKSGLLRGLMFLHMKAGLDADTIRLRFSQRSYQIERAPLSRFGVRKDFQQALADLRTDLDAFTPEEARALMACGYKMAENAFKSDLRHLSELSDEPKRVAWPFQKMLDEITSPVPATADRERLLRAFADGSEVTM